MRRSAYLMLVPLAGVAAAALAACGGDDFASAEPAVSKGGSSGGPTSSGGRAGSVGGGKGGMSAGAAGTGAATTGKGGTGGTGGSTTGPKCSTDADCNGPTTNRCEGRRVCSVSPGGSFCVVTGGAVDADDNNACTVDTCDPKTGDVAHEPVPLNDDDPCTIDTCDPTIGVAHTPKGGDCDGCKTAADCNDDLPCTEDVCGANGKCVSTNRAVTEICRSEDECFGPSLCDGKGVCKPGVAKPLADEDLCTADRCVGGKIVHDPPAPNPDLCTETTCDKKTGVTTTRSRADDDTKCTDDTCDAKTGNVTHTPVAALSDNDPCTKDACDPLDGAISHTTIIGCTGCTEPKDCDDQSDCTVDTCTAGICTHENLPAGKACGNGVTCDGAEVCDANGKCLPGTPLAIDDGNACTVDACVEPGGVKRTEVDKDDKNPCTLDTCDKLKGVQHTLIEGCSTCSKDADCGTVSPSTCQQISCVAGVCTKSKAPAGTNCSLSDRLCAACTEDGLCNVYDGNPNICNGRCGTLTLQCGSVDCKGCLNGNVCNPETNKCSTTPPP